MDPRIVHSQPLRVQAISGMKREFHIARAIRDRFDFKEELFSSTGSVIFQSIHAVRLFVQKFNDGIDLVKYPERAMRAGHLNAMGLIDEIFHFVIQLYREHTGLEPFIELVSALQNSLGAAFEEALIQFVSEFPPREVYAGSLSPEAYVRGKSGEVPNRAIILEELIVLWLTNVNPACDRYKSLFDDANLRRETAYKEIIAAAEQYFRQKPPFGPDSQPLVEMLRSPALSVPHSLSGQLRYMRERWGALLGKYLFRLLSGLDLIREEEKGFVGGPGPTRAYTYSGLGSDHEGFSPDKEWMPTVVLIAKSALVWLDQLAKKYRRTIERLDQIPDEELDILRDRGFTSLWLIGLWERSPASKRIKQLCGNPDAEASAYSIYSYNVSAELGGWEAVQNLRERCLRRSIRLACDMVPNHTGIDSDWVVNRPERFIQLPYAPFPSYTYGGENLASSAGVGIFLEDHYFDQKDAAVTFKRVDFATGQTTYIYHGNDGTHMPWNDTAQLNFLDPAVREAVIQTILHVAHNFPIIRFDAAMTLAKEHIQRLWYPLPGSGGDIPSRSEHAMTADELNEAIPREFWREVVDRVAAEVPDTLLLAEAFWMMEGYFVRSLGMHRVYNSAFMNMLKDEENAKYRTTIKNTIEFDPEILKRFVNFMNNPDEETAIRQFGDGDKYFGVCTLMVTMPGLPMFGHGQIEGYAEKYGMEYRRARTEEMPNEELIRRHERDIFPLVKRRYLFAEAENFRLYDLHFEDGTVNEDIFAYSNRAGGERSIVVYNNRYERSRGRFNSSASFAQRSSSGKTTRSVRIGDELGLSSDPAFYVAFREQRSGLWFLRQSREILEDGFYVELSGYESQVFLDFHEIEDNSLGHYRLLAGHLAGRGTRDIDTALKEIFVEPIHTAFHRLAAGELLASVCADNFDPSSLESSYRAFLQAGCAFSHIEMNDAAVGAMTRWLTAVRTVDRAATHHEKSAGAQPDDYASFLDYGREVNPAAGTILALLAFLTPIARLLSPDNRFAARSLIDEWMLDGPVERALASTDHPATDDLRVRLLMRIVPTHASWYWDILDSGSLAARVEQLFQDEIVRRWLGENRYEGVLWFHRESFLELVWWLFISAVLGVHAEIDDEHKRDEHLRSVFALTKSMLAALERSDYQVEHLVAALRSAQQREPGKQGSKGGKQRLK